MNRLSIWSTILLLDLLLDYKRPDGPLTYLNAVTLFQLNFKRASRCPTGKWKFMILWASLIPHTLYGLFQQLSVFFQPSLCLFHGRGLGADDVPESGSVVGLDEVGQLMNNGVVNDKHGRFH